MIKYQLICDNAHGFEGWFQNAEAYDDQHAAGVITCPVCETMSVSKALMTPNLASSKTYKMPVPIMPDDPVHSGKNVPDQRTAVMPVPVHGAKGVSGIAPEKVPAKIAEQMPEKVAEQMAEIMSELRQIQRKIRSECRDVGDNFAKEARKMHYGEAEPEGIYGHTTPEERAELDEEGIEIVEMPLLPLDN